jgi:hypothetical protein
MAQPQPSGLPASFPPRLWFHFHVPSIALSVPGCILLLPFSPPPFLDQALAWREVRDPASQL